MHQCLRHGAGKRDLHLVACDPRPSLLQLFLTFLRLGVTTFGGPSMVAYIRRVTVEQKHWLEMEVFNAGVAMCQMIPGATAMQTTAYVGLKKRGAAGAAVCFIGFGLPAFILMMTFAALYSATHHLPAVVSAFKGLQAITVAIVAYATWTFGNTTLKNWKQFLIAAFAAALFGFKINPLLVILLAALAGLVLIQPKPLAQPRPIAGIDFSSYKAFIAVLAIGIVGFLLLFIFDEDLFRLAILFSRIDLTAFGGGFA